MLENREQFKLKKAIALKQQFMHVILHFLWPLQ